MLNFLKWIGFYWYSLSHFFNGWSRNPSYVEIGVCGTLEAATVIGRETVDTQVVATSFNSTVGFTPITGGLSIAHYNERKLRFFGTVRVTPHGHRRSGLRSLQWKAIEVFSTVRVTPHRHRRSGHRSLQWKATKVFGTVRVTPRGHRRSGHRSLQWKATKVFQYSKSHTALSHAVWVSLTTMKGN